MKIRNVIKASQLWISLNYDAEKCKEIIGFDKKPTKKNNSLYK